MIFRRMVRGLEFDVSEMALSTYLCARHYGKAFTALPVFLTRAFYHDGIAVKNDPSIKSAGDLTGMMAPPPMSHHLPRCHMAAIESPRVRLFARCFAFDAIATPRSSSLPRRRG